ncbi:MAG TPA: pitrilysin family protein, partial [Armatimonadota bacterium]|nr:pitrilysin family protein [Armatimonadota bacterium]
LPSTSSLSGVRVRAPRSACKRPRATASLVTAWLCLLGLALTAIPARTGTLDAAEIRETVFPNGLRLIVKPAHATELAAVQVWIRAGGFLEDERSVGTAHAIEHLVFKGSETSGAIDAEIENLGGLLEASTEKDFTRFGCTIAGRYVGKVLQVIGDAVRKPQFRAADLATEKPLIIEEIEQMRLDPEVGISALLYDLAFQKHPYKRDVRGAPDLVNALTLDAVRAYYQKHYVPSNMTVVVVGDVDPAGVERATRAAFQADQPAPKAAPLPLPAPERAGATPVRRVLAGPFTGGFVGLAFPAPSVKDEPDVHAMDVLLTMLEHGPTGRLPRAVRGTAPVKASFETRRQAGLFTVIAATGAVPPERVEALLRQELSFVGTHAIPEAELSLAKRALRGTYALDNEPYAGQAGSLGFYASIDRWQFATEYLAKVDAVTAEQVQAVARKYLDPNHSVAVLLTPRPSTQPQPPRSGT